MEALSLAVGIILMLVAAIGIVFYVALVIAIPVCRLLDWISGEKPNERTTGMPEEPLPPRSTTSLVDGLTGRAPPDCHPKGKDS